MIRLDGKVAIVTGAGRGMGRTHALLLAERGARVLVNDYGGEPTTIQPGTISTAQAVVDEIRAAGGVAEADGTMVGTGAAAGAIVDHALDAFGRVDILVNNCGGALIGPPDAFSDEEIEGVLRANFIGPYMLLRRVWPHMKAQNWGRIVNVLSSALLGGGSLAPYAAGKAGLFGLTNDAAIDGKPHNILVNGILPTGTSRLTEGTHEDIALWYREWFQPEKVSAFVAYLCSDEVSFTGEAFNVGGGRVAKLGIYDGDGFFDREITPESVAAGIDQARDLSRPVPIPTLWAQTERYFPVLPWTGGKLALH